MIYHGSQSRELAKYNRESTGERPAAQAVGPGLEPGKLGDLGIDVAANGAGEGRARRVENMLQSWPGLALDWGTGSPIVKHDQQTETHRDTRTETRESKRERAREEPREEKKAGVSERRDGWAGPEK